MTLRQMHREIGQMLADAGIADPRREAAILLSHFLSLPVSAIYTKPDLQVTAEQQTRLADAADQRAKRTPLAYILGQTDFAGLTFLVGPGVLVPRPDSELLVETGITVCRQLWQAADGKSPLDILDICAGTGCIGISLHLLLKGNTINSRLWLTEIDDTAIAYAKKNLVLHGLADTAYLEQTDLFPVDPDQQWDLITANPPYIESKVIQELMPEVRCHEPVIALDGGSDGLDFYRRLIKLAAGRLKPGGYLLLEHGFDQAESVAKIFHESGQYAFMPLIRDYGGQPRVSGGIYHPV